MKIFPEDPVFVVEQAGFDDLDADRQPLDLLGRKPLGQKLTDLVDRINQPLVIALDGGWGSGKSHFLKLWTGAHGKELGGKAEVIYFDSFEHDYLDDPLVSLVSRLVVLGEAKSWSAKALDKVKKSAMPLVKGALRTGLAVVTAGVSEATGPVLDAVVGKVSDMTDDQIGDFWKQETGRIAAMAQFKKALEDLTQPKAEDDAARKIVFIVDELDRCRPDYALSLLEIIKHFFAVPNVHFVLGVTLDALENSVRSRYGAQIDATKYLQKFVMLTMLLPQKTNSNPDVNAALRYFSEKAPRYVTSAAFYEQCSERFARPIVMHGATLRDVQRLLAVMALFPKRHERLRAGYTTILIGAIYLKALYPQQYARLKSNVITLEELTKCLSLEQPKADTDYNIQNRDWVIWAYALNGNHVLKMPGVPPHLIEGLPLAFDDYGQGFRWPTAQALIADALESFELPTT